MASEEKKILTPEEKKREKELLEKEKAEKARIDKMQKEKAHRRKLKEKRLKAEKKREIKRIKTLVNLPFKLLLHISLLITMFLAIVLYFWIELDIKTTLLYLFFIFSLVYFGVGGVMVAVFYLLGEDRKKELEEARRLEQQALQLEEQRLLQEEALKLSEIERDIAERKSGSMKSKELLPEQAMPESIPDSGEELEPRLLGESAPSLSDPFNQDFSEMYPNDLAEEQAMPIGSGEPHAEELSAAEYFDEIMSPNFETNLNKQ